MFSCGVFLPSRLKRYFVFYGFLSAFCCFYFIKGLSARHLYRCFDDAGAGAVTGEQVAGALEKLDPFGGGAYGDLKALPLITVAAEMVKAASSGSELEFGGFIMKFRGVNDDGS